MMDGGTDIDSMADRPLGPFTVVPTQISSLGAAFTPFVNALLRAQVAAAELSGSRLTTTYQENIGDRGVDAGLRGATESRFIPAGDSAWQFKRGDLGPTACKRELAGASRALEILRAGGKYRLVVGVDINEDQVHRRREALREEAERLGVVLDNDTIDVLNASDLAEWAERHPSLAVSQLLGGIRGSAEDFDEWSNSTGATTTWVESDARKVVDAKITDLIENDGHVGLHIEGVSGLGKSRSVLEALRNKPYKSLVVYVRDADSFPPSLIRYLTGEGRVAILVVDECDPKQHKNLSAAIPAGSGLRLITMGEPAPSRSVHSSLALPPIENDRLAEILRLNHPSLWHEATSFVVEFASGNVQLALVLAEAIEQEPRASAGRLITRDIVRLYVTESLPEGTTFHACCALALFPRIGFTQEAAGELRFLAEALGVPEPELRAGARALMDLGLLSSKGRYRSVTPQPLAVFLASRAWDDFEDPILNHLLPSLDGQSTERLVHRAAEIGPSPSILRAVRNLLARNDFFGSVQALEESGYADVLTQLAILAPQEVASRLVSVIGDATSEELIAAQHVRSDLVGTLEKLAWHSATFDKAADALLQLAINEIQDYANNATSVWCSLFGVVLPSTAATPSARLAYLTRVSQSPDVAVRRLVAMAAARLVDTHETVIFSAELQGGVVVEPRGRPATYGDVWEYQRAGIRLLRQLVDDTDAEISASALNALVKAIHPFLEYEPVRGDLFEALRSLPEDGLRRVRTELTHLNGLFQRVSVEDGRQAGLEMLSAMLPSPSVIEELKALVHANSWDLENGELERRILDLSDAMDDSGPALLLGLLDEQDLPAAFELGKAMSKLAPGQQTLDALAPRATGRNSPALVGYLWGLYESGLVSAFDDFLDGETRQTLTPAVRLALTVRGPRSEEGWRRVEETVAVLSPAEGATGMFGWHVDIPVERLVALLNGWLGRIETQADYNAVVDRIALALFKEDSTWIEELDPLVVQLVVLRHSFPLISGHQDWNWVQLAKRQLQSSPFELLNHLVRMLEENELHIFRPSEEQALLAEAIRNSGPQGWELIMSTLEGGTWRLRHAFNGWLLDVLPPEEITSWVGADEERARLISRITEIGEGPPHPVVRYLLEHFSENEKIAGNLATGFISGSYWSDESEHIIGQIAQLQEWVQSPDEPEGVKRWARQMIEGLSRRRESALEEEAEEEW
jgi:hypothetical protein